MKNKILDKVILRILDAKTALFIALFAIVAFVIITLSFYHSEIIPYKFFEQATGNYAQLIAGVVGSLLSFAGIILIYVTFKEQRESNQAQEIKLNQQTELFNQQQFETTFFNLLSNHFQLINSFNGQTGTSIHSVGKIKKDGYVLLNDCYEAFDASFLRVAESQINAPYSNFLTINYHPLEQASINEQIVIKAISHLLTIINFIGDSLTRPRLAQRNEDVLTYAFATHQQKFLK